LELAQQESGQQGQPVETLSEYDPNTKDEDC